MKWLVVLVLGLALLSLAGCPRFHAAPPPGAPDQSFVDVGGVSIHYRELGKGDDRKAIVLIHGYGASSDEWRGVDDVLAHHFHVIALDLPGFGWSSRPDMDYSPEAEAKLAWRALDRLGVGDAALVGHSWGSSVVLAMTLEQPARVRRVALYSAYVYEDQVASFFHWARLGGIGEALFALWYRERIEDRVALAYHDDRYITQARVEHVEDELARPGTTAAALAAARGQRYSELEKRYPSIAQPVLLLWGDDDQVTPLRFGERLARELPDATLKVYPACGHVPMVEARRPTTHDLLGFLLADSTETVTAQDVPALVDTIDLGEWANRVPLHSAADIALLGAELAPRKFASPREHTEIDLHGALRVRGESLYNLDLDHGLDANGQPLFPVPLDGGQTLDDADMRMRGDFAAYARGAGVAVKARFDVLNDTVLGSTPRLGGDALTPAASTGQAGGVVEVERIWGEVLTPFGIVAAGRMGAHWGLGMVANGGDCDDCDGGDAADRIALLTPIAGHFLALSYDLDWSGPLTKRKDGIRSVELTPTDDVNTVTAALLRSRTPASLLRRAAAGLATVEYGAYVSHRWQAKDVPAAYLPVAAPPGIDATQLVDRDFSATTTGAWLRILSPVLRIEAEGAYAHARVGQPSLIPGVELSQPVTSNQAGLAVETEVSIACERIGLDGGFASGDSAPGLDGPQADPPADTTVDNFRFHPDYRIDRILFHEIVGTVTDAAYVRPHGSVGLLHLGHATLDADVALIASWAMEPTSTPSGARRLGVEIDPGLTYVTRDGFRAALEYAVLFPGPAFAPAFTAQLVRARLGYVF